VKWIFCHQKNDGECLKDSLGNKEVREEIKSMEEKIQVKIMKLGHRKKLGDRTDTNRVKEG
jgi:hypothetical protein